MPFGVNTHLSDLSDLTTEDTTFMHRLGLYTIGDLLDQTAGGRRY